MTEEPWERHSGSVKAARESLGLAKTTFHRYMKSLGITAGRRHGRGTRKRPHVSEPLLKFTRHRVILLDSAKLVLDFLIEQICGQIEKLPVVNLVIRIVE